MGPRVESPRHPTRPGASGGAWRAPFPRAHRAVGRRRGGVDRRARRHGGGRLGVGHHTGRPHHRRALVSAPSPGPKTPQNATPETAGGAPGKRPRRARPKRPKRRSPGRRPAPRRGRPPRAPPAPGPWHKSTSPRAAGHTRPAPPRAAPWPAPRRRPCRSPGGCAPPTPTMLRSEGGVGGGCGRGVKVVR